MLVTVCCDIGVHLSVVSLGVAGGRDAELSEVRASLLGALVGVGVLDSKPKHSGGGLPRVEDVFDLAFKLEEIVLSQVNFLQLQPDSFFNNGLQILHHFVVFLLLFHSLVYYAIVGYCLKFKVVVTVLHNSCKKLTLETYKSRQKRHLLPSC